MAATDLPDITEVADFLHALREFRSKLSGQAQRLLDTLVTAGLGQVSSITSIEEVNAIWTLYATGNSRVADPAGNSRQVWTATPWGRAYRERFA